MNRMYEENVKSLNPFVGCLHDCVYCKPSFQAQMKRQKKRCTLCYDFKPHFHPERLLKPPPRTEEGEFIFFPSMGDPVFCRPDWFLEMREYAWRYHDRRFLTQTKNPIRLFEPIREMPNNMFKAATIETNLTEFDTPSKYKSYSEISKAPPPPRRVCDLDVVTVEPILDFKFNGMVNLIWDIHPEIVYIGYDNHNCRLPEPPLKKTLELIEKLEKFAEVRRKTIRKAWYEEASP